MREADLPLRYRTPDAWAEGVLAEPLKHRLASSRRPRGRLENGCRLLGDVRQDQTIGGQTGLACGTSFRAPFLVSLPHSTRNS